MTTYLYSSMPPYLKPIHYATSGFADMFVLFQTPHYGQKIFNTGLLLFESALERIIVGEKRKFSISEVSEFSDSDTFVTTQFHSINYANDNFISYWNKFLDSFPGKVVLMSCGVINRFDQSKQSSISPNGRLITKDLVILLSRIAEGSQIGCRDEFTATLLNDNGIKNTQIIGCPCLYYHKDRNYRLENVGTISSINFNYSGCSAPGMSFIYWFKNLSKMYKVNFIAQHVDENLFFNGSINYVELKDFIVDSGHAFFDTVDWINFIKGTDFTIGGMFHGCCASVLAGVPALFIAHDTRIQGMCEYFKLPMIIDKDFDPAKPIEYYAELADYTEFNKNYSKVYDNMIAFCNSNGVSHSL